MGLKERLRGDRPGKSHLTTQTVRVILSSVGLLGSDVGCKKNQSS
jgi:hypothetical protein